MLRSHFWTLFLSQPAGGGQAGHSKHLTSWGVASLGWVSAPREVMGWGWG